MEPYRNTDDYENEAEQEVASINVLKAFLETTIAEEREKVMGEVLAYVEPQMQMLNNSNDMEKCYIQDKFYAGMFAGYQRVRMHFLSLKELN